MRAIPLSNLTWDSNEAMTEDVDVEGERISLTIVGYYEA
jgi:hypothetical protein